MRRFVLPDLGVKTHTFEEILDVSGYVRESDGSYFVEDHDSRILWARIKELQALERVYAIPQSEAERAQGDRDCVHCGHPVAAERGYKLSKYDDSHFRKFGRCQL